MTRITTKTRWTGPWLPVVALCAALSLGGCTGEADTANTSPSPTAPAQRGEVSPEATPSTNLSVVIQAGETALQALEGSSVVGIDSENNGTVWEVDLVTSDGTKHEGKVSGDGTKVLAGPTQETQTASDKAKHQRRISAATLDFREAAAVMVSTIPHGTITDLELDTENGKVVWEADLLDPSGVKHEVEIDATSGTVLSTAPDS